MMPNKIRKHSSGFTLTEILVILSIISLFATISIPPLQTFIQKLRFHGCLRQISQLMRQGQTLARETYLPCRLVSDQGKVILQKKKEGTWQTTRFSCSPATGIQIKFNQIPVFYPSGAIVPLCTVTVTLKQRKYSLTISAAGRIRSQRVS